MIVSLLQVGCLVLDEEHCLANGGDLACPGRRCLLQTGPKVKTRTDGFGCSDTDANIPYHVHLTYGLPAGFELGGGNKSLDTVTGILVALEEENGVGGSCPLNSPELQDELDETKSAHSDIYILRNRLDRGYVDRSETKISQEEADDVAEFNGTVERWRDACLEGVQEEDSDTNP